MVVLATWGITSTTFYHDETSKQSQVKYQFYYQLAEPSTNFTGILNQLYLFYSRNSILPTSLPPFYLQVSFSATVC